jgi:hypothetical protein
VAVSVTDCAVPDVAITLEVAKVAKVSTGIKPGVSGLGMFCATTCGVYTSPAKVAFILRGTPLASDLSKKSVTA